jgi:exodeoxyribonuclease V beta subunit
MSDMMLDLYRHGVIEAHAGTGKTFTIVELVLRLLKERRLSLSEILLVTYTEKAAGELTDRIRKKLTESVQDETDKGVREHLEACQKELGDCLIGTIHGICLRLLRAWPFESGTSFATELVDDEDGLEEALRETLRSGAWKPEAAPADLFARILSEARISGHMEKALALAKLCLDETVVVEPEGIEDDWEREDEGALAACFQVRWAKAAAMLWNAKKASQGMLSFQDMLGRMALAVKNDNFRQILRDKVRVGVIDEFQDTSGLQWSIFRTWFVEDVPAGTSPAKRPVLFLVGDPKQSIYSFQGADVSTYLTACDLLEAAPHRAQRKPLMDNYRSLPALIEGYNQVLSPRQVAKGKGKKATVEEEDWFLDSNPRLAYVPGKQARFPERKTAPVLGLPEGLDEFPVRLFRTDLSASAGRTQYAQACAGWIKTLCGREVDLPEGTQWKRHTLGWGDFAVIAGSRSVVRFFRKAFDKASIPWALYKQEGVFASRAALELRAVLAGLHAGPQENGLWRKALATRVFDGDEASLDAAHAHAVRARWSRLMRTLTTATGVQGRLLAGACGEREWMDWRQVCAHCLDYLVAGKGNLPELVEHLGRLARNEESAQEDRNLHARATDRSRVQILTMHASKGLEFPVVFLAETGGSNQMPTHSWIQDGVLHAMPSISVPKKDATAWHRGIEMLKHKAKEAKEKERRRLHYVALTRPKLLLVSHCLEKRPDPLSKALLPLLDAPPARVALLDPPSLTDRVQSKECPAPAGAGIHTATEVEELAVASRLRVQTSYSQIQRETAMHLALDGRVTRSEESADRGAVASSGPDLAPAPDEWLPRGAHTGDALHEILETWLSPEKDLGWLKEDAVPETVTSHVERTLSLHGLKPTLAAPVIALLRQVLATPIDLGDGDALRLEDLAPCDRRPEVEFHWAFGPDGQILSEGGKARGWMVGYIDLLFRHGGRWHVLDWKTTSLGEWTAARLEESMEHHGYCLQADLYRQMLSRALPRGEEVGKAVYLYLRAFVDPVTAPNGIWISPDAVQNRITPALRGWLETRHAPKGMLP